MAGKKRKKPRVVKGMPSVEVSREEFRRRFLVRFGDPAYEAHAEALDALADTAYEAYDDYRKSPRTRPAGKGFADPEAEVAIEWLETRERIQEAARAHKRKGEPSRILLVNGSSRSDQTCPGEMSKTWRLVQRAQEVLEKQKRVEVDVLDLSRLTSEAGRVIYPCKACVSTAMPLCNWPCSCYPNHALGQTGDWMGEIYPRWVAAHGVLIITPVNWYQAPSVLKLMIDRLVCADGGNPDPTRTGGKDPERAKALELEGWDYPKHLAGRAFAVVVHADAAGAENLRRILVDWLTDMALIPAGPSAGLDRYVGYYESYAESHDHLDADEGFFTEVENQARALLETVRQIRAGRYRRPDADLEPPREK